MNSIETIQKLLDSFSGFKKREVENGTVIVGHIPCYGEEYYHFELYPASEAMIELIDDLPLALPNDIVAFYKKYNGFYALGGLFSIYGHITMHYREGDSSYQPFSIQELNSYMRPKERLDNEFLFGSSKMDESIFLYSPDDTLIHRVTKKGQVLESWSTFDEMFAQYCQRLIDLLDDDGKFWDIATAPRQLQLLAKYNQKKQKGADKM